MNKSNPQDMFRQIGIDYFGRTHHLPDRKEVKEVCCTTL